jgi:predicted NBD/HSP70 family sugar kinase
MMKQNSAESQLINRHDLLIDSWRLSSQLENQSNRKSLSAMTTPVKDVYLQEHPQSGMRGSSQSGVRLYNERLVLSLVRTHGNLPKAEIAKLTGLSPQTVSVIVRQLEAEGLLLKGKSLKGKVGQPLQPFSLNPEGAYSIGLKIGRRSCNLICLDLLGNPCARHDEVYSYPTPSVVIRIAREGLRRIEMVLGPDKAARICGVGIASPFELWNWAQETGAPPHVMASWHGVNIATEVAALSPWPVQFCNDATAACAAEHFLGRGRTIRDFICFYVGFFVGGGVVLNGNLFPGRTGYAGAVGPMPVPAAKGTEQLIRHASLYVLENMLTAAGQDPLILTRQTESWDNIGSILDDWIDQTARSLAHAALSAAAILDFEAVIIDGSMPPHVRRRLVDKTIEYFADQDARGIAPLAIVEGVLGGDARALGAASLPIIANFMINREVLFKESL